MSKLLRALCLAGLSLLVMSCPLPQVAGVPDTGSSSPAAGQPPAPAVSAPKVMTDLARNQAVYVDENGTKIDIVGQEADGSTVAGTEAVGLAVVGDASSQGSGTAGAAARSLSDAGTGERLRAIVVGARPDGSGGAWAVLSNRLVLPAGGPSGYGGTSALPECDDRGDHGLHGWMGWTYVVTGISDDGAMIIGEAVNKKGFHRAGVDIDAGTTVGVYWWVTKIDHRPYVRISYARVIGTLDTSTLPHKKGPWKKWLDNVLKNRLSRLQLFFLDYFSAYLTEADTVTYDQRRGFYLVTGLDQDDNDATATITRDNAIVITPTVTPPADQPDLVVSSIQAPSTLQTISSTWTLGATVVNSGTGNAGPFTLLYQVSAKSTLDSTAVTIGTHTVSALAAGGTYTDTWSTTFSIPQGGTHWIFVTADSANAVAESNETNNTSSAAVPIVYPRVVIETYDPNGTAFTSPFISLFGPNGDTTADPVGTGPNEWNDDNPPYTVDAGVAIAESGTTGTWVSIDYQGGSVVPGYEHGLPPGVYYVRVRGAQSYQSGAYAIRFLSLNPGDPLPAYATLALNPADSPYEPDDALVAPANAIPLHPVAAVPGSVFSRYLDNAGSDMDWFQLTLP